MWQFGVVSLLTVFVKLRIRTSSAVYLKLRARNIFGVHPDVRNGVWCVFVCDVHLAVRCLRGTTRHHLHRKQGEHQVGTRAAHCL